MNYEEIRFTLKALLAQPDPDTYALLLRRSHFADLSVALDSFPLENAAKILEYAPTETLGDLFGYLRLELQWKIVETFTPKALATLLVHLPTDERADLFKSLPEETRDKLLPALAQAEREDIRRLTSYEEGTVGSVMTSDYATLRGAMSLHEAIHFLRKVASDMETINQMYVVDDQHKLMGSVALHELILSPPETLVSALVKRDPIAIQADAPRSEAVNMIAKYDFLALPVVDKDNTLVGIVTVDDALDVAEAEATEDFHKVGGMRGLSVDMKTAAVSVLYRKRVFWLVVLVFGNIFSGAGIAYFEDIIAAHVALVFFLPLLIDSGGNAGAQASTLMVRALATGDVHLRDWAGMLGRELLVAGLLGATMAIAVATLGILRGGIMIAFIVALTMQLVVIVGSLVGMSLPFLLSRFKLDPATASAPLITSIADASGVVIYFAIASALLTLDA